MQILNNLNQKTPVISSNLFHLTLTPWFLHSINQSYSLVVKSTWLEVQTLTKLSLGQSIATMKNPKNLKLKMTKWKNLVAALESHRQGISSLSLVVLGITVICYRLVSDLTWKQENGNQELLSIKHVPPFLVRISITNLFLNLEVLEKTKR